MFYLSRAKTEAPVTASNGAASASTRSFTFKLYINQITVLMIRHKHFCTRIHIGEASLSILNNLIKCFGRIYDAGLLQCLLPQTQHNTGGRLNRTHLTLSYFVITTMLTRTNDKTFCVARCGAARCVWHAAARPDVWGRRGALGLRAVHRGRWRQRPRRRRSVGGAATLAPCQAGFLLRLPCKLTADATCRITAQVSINLLYWIKKYTIKVKSVKT